MTCSRTSLPTHSSETLIGPGACRTVLPISSEKIKPQVDSSDSLATLHRGETLEKFFPHRIRGARIGRFKVPTLFGRSKFYDDDRDVVTRSLRFDRALDELGRIRRVQDRFGSQHAFEHLFPGNDIACDFDHAVGIERQYRAFREIER